MTALRSSLRDPDAAARYARLLAGTVTRPWTIMEVCGGQTHAILRHGLQQLLPPGLTLVHGPGCPVCVTPPDYLDKAVEIARLPGVVLCTFGDMLRVPGRHGTLQDARARGADVRVVYSPLDAVRIARESPGRQVVFLAVGFETTAPANALAAHQALQSGLTNFSLLVAHVLVPPAMAALLDAPGHCIQGFLAAGHVCTIMGLDEYAALVARYHVPIVVTGFEPLDILQGLLMCVRQLESGRAEVENQYARVVQPQGNVAARQLVAQVFAPGPRHWRGLGAINGSGLALRPPYSALDAEQRFGGVHAGAGDEGECIAGRILRGEVRPPACAAFGSRCTPEHPLGVTMVSEEGACAAYYRYRRAGVPAEPE